MSVWLSNAGHVDASAVPDVVLTGVETYGRFGSACAVLDFNLDGRPGAHPLTIREANALRVIDAMRADLVVGAPSTGGKNLVAVVGTSHMHDIS